MSYFDEKILNKSFLNKISNHYIFGKNFLGGRPPSLETKILRAWSPRPLSRTAYGVVM